MKTLLEYVDDRFEVIIKEIKEVLKALEEIKICNKLLLNGEYFLTDSELSKILKISRRTLQDYRSRRIITYYRIDGKILYRESDVEKMLQKNYLKSFDEMRFW